MKKIIILALLLLALPVDAASWDTAGNIVGVNDFIGSTNANTQLKFKIGGQERMQINTDGIRFNGTNPIFSISNNNGQFTFLHNTTNGCTAIFANLSTVPKTLNLCTDGLTLTGGTINAKTSYRVTSGADTVTATDYTIESDGGDEQLPTATGNAGRFLNFINTGNGELMIHAQGGQLIGNKNPEEMYRLFSGESITLVGNGTGWRILPSKN